MPPPSPAITTFPLVDTQKAGAIPRSKPLRWTTRLIFYYNSSHRRQWTGNSGTSPGTQQTPAETRRIARPTPHETHTFTCSPTRWSALRRGRVGRRRRWRWAGRWDRGGPGRWGRVFGGSATRRGRIFDTSCGSAGGKVRHCFDAMYVSTFVLSRDMCASVYVCFIFQVE